MEKLRNIESLFGIATKLLSPSNSNAIVSLPLWITFLPSKSIWFSRHLNNKSSSSNPHPKYSLEYPFICLNKLLGNAVTPPKYSSNNVLDTPSGKSNSVIRCVGLETKE